MGLLELALNLEIKRTSFESRFAIDELGDILTSQFSPLIRKG